MPLVSPIEFLEFLKRAHDESQLLSQEIRFDKEHALHRHVIALYGSIIELTGSAILLVDKRLLSGTPVLLRSILEAYVDLCNLIENPRFGYALELSYIKEWLKILHEAQGGRNEYLLAISEAPLLPDSIAQWQSRKRKLEAEGHRSLTIEQKFQRIGMEKEYKSIYNSLCCDAHNNLRALVDRHIEIGQADFEVVFYKAYTPEDGALEVGTNAELLIRASEKVHQFFDSHVMEKIAALRSELNRLRSDSE
jgi:hypothetical protein